MSSETDVIAPVNESLDKSTAPFEFSGKQVEDIEKAMFRIRQLTLICNAKIDQFKQNIEKLPPGVEDLAEILNLQWVVLDEKYSLLFGLITDVYSKLDELKSTTDL